MRYPADEIAERHERLLRAASEMFRERGFDRVTVAQVMEAAGLTHGAFYSHYDSKEDLMVAATEYAMQSTLDKLKDNVLSEDDRLAYIERYLSPKHRDNPGTGCAMSGLSAEVRHELEVKPVFSSKLGQIVQALSANRDEAIFTISALVGAMTLARAVSDEAFSTEILSAVAREFRKGPAPDTRPKQAKKRAPKLLGKGNNTRS